MKMIPVFLLLFLGCSISFGSTGYIDIKSSHWAKKDIDFMREIGVSGLLSSVNFYPKKKVSVEEFKRTIEGLSGKKIYFGFTGKYVTKKEAVLYLKKISTLKKKVSVNNRHINRAQLVSLVGAAGLLQDVLPAKDYLYDVYKNDWYYKDVLKFVAKGGLIYLEGNRFKPKKKVKFIEFYRVVAFLEGYYSDRSFSSNQELFRYVKKLYRVNAKYSSYVTKKEVLDVFSDINWDTQNIISSNSYVNRAQLMAIVARLYKNKTTSTDRVSLNLINALNKNNLEKSSLPSVDVIPDLTNVLSQSSEETQADIEALTEDADEIKGAGSFLLSKEFMAEQEKKKNEKKDQYTLSYGLETYTTSEQLKGKVIESNTTSYSGGLGLGLVMFPFELSISYGYDHNNNNRDDSLINTLVGGSGSLELDEGTLLILYTRSFTANHDSLFLIGNFFNLLLLKKEPVLMSDMTQFFVNASTIMGVQHDNIDEKPGKAWSFGLSQKYFENYTFSYEHGYEFDVDDNKMVSNLWGVVCEYDLSDNVKFSILSDFSYYNPDGGFDKKYHDISYSSELIYSWTDKLDFYCSVSNDKSGIDLDPVSSVTEYSIGLSGEL